MQLLNTIAAQIKKQKKQQLQPLPLLPKFQVWLERVHLKFLFPKGTFYNYILDIRTRKMKDTKRR